MLDEVTYGLLNGKIKKLEDNAGGLEKTKLSEFENDLFYSKDVVLCSATKDDFQSVNDGETSFYLANLLMNQGYSDDLKLENLELKMTGSEGEQSYSFLLKLVEENQDGVREFEIYFPGIDELGGVLIPKAKMEQDFSVVYPVEDSAILMIEPILATFAESFTFIHKDIKKIPNEVVDLNEFIATYGVTTYAEIFEAATLGKKCYILDPDFMIKVPVTSVLEDMIIGNLETFSPNGLQLEMLLMAVNFNNEWLKDKVVIQSAYNMTSDIEDTSPESYPSTEAVRNALQKVLPMPEVASVGQYFRAKSVDEAGKITEVEAVDGGMPIINTNCFPGTVEEPVFLGEELASAVQSAIEAGQPFIAFFNRYAQDGSVMISHAVFAPQFGAAIGFCGTMALVMQYDPESEGVLFAGMDTSPLGDIEAALDAILAIQNELIGGEGE